MQDSGKGQTTRLIVAISILASLALIVIVLGLSGYLLPLLDRLREVFAGKDQMRQYVESWGAYAPAAFILIQTLQVVIAPIPGEFTGAVGGFIFGAMPNIVYSSIGLTLGSILAFAAARIVGLPLVELVISRATLEKFHFLTERRGILIILVLYIIPGFPKDILSYLVGLSPMGFVPFVAACGLGRLPGTVMLSYSGSAVYDENWPLLAAVSTLCVVVLVLFFLFRAKIEVWLRKTGGESF